MSATTSTATTTAANADVKDAETTHTTRPRRSTRSDFNLEPNPFEQSFRTPHSSNLRQSNGQSESAEDDANGLSSADSKADNADFKQKSETPPPVLPPAANIASPADPHNYSQWGFSPSLTNSLRAGPLSPAMLAGPQMGGYDPNTFRSGFTPRTGLTPRTGMTPGIGSGLTPLIGGSVSFPPPSPNTAAFLALMTANQQNSHTTTASNLHQSDTITPNTFSAITGGAFNTSSNKNAEHQQYAGVANGHRHDSAKDAKGHGSNASAVSYAASTAADGLFLLSQAHQELLKRDQDARVATSENNQSAPTAKIAPGRKRKAAPAAPTAKRTRNARGRNAEVEDDEDDDDDDESMPDFNSDNKNETEEEKRKNFLERNRQAALKCRQRKKAWLTQLQSQNEYLKAENDRLQTALVAAREEISRMSGLAPAPAGGKAGHGPPIAVAVSQVASNGRGYGY